MHTGAYQNNVVYNNNNSKQSFWASGRTQHPSTNSAMVPKPGGRWHTSAQQTSVLNGLLRAREDLENPLQLLARGAAIPGPEKEPNSGKQNLLERQTQAWLNSPGFWREWINFYHKQCFGFLLFFFLKTQQLYFKDLNSFLFICTCVSVSTWVLVPVRARRGHWAPWRWSNSHLWGRESGDQKPKSVLLQEQQPSELRNHLSSPQR